MKGASPINPESWERELNNIRLGTRQNYKEKLVAEGILQQLRSETLGVIDKCQADISNFRTNSSTNQTPSVSRGESLFTPSSLSNPYTRPRSLLGSERARLPSGYKDQSVANEGYSGNVSALNLAAPGVGMTPNVEVWNRGSPEGDWALRVAQLEDQNAVLVAQLAAARSECSSAKARVIELEGVLDGLGQRGLREPLRQLTSVTSTASGNIEDNQVIGGTPNSALSSVDRSIGSSSSSKAVADLLASVHLTLSQSKHEGSSALSSSNLSITEKGCSGDIYKLADDTRLESVSDIKTSTSSSSLAPTPQKLDREFMM